MLMIGKSHSIFKCQSDLIFHIHTMNKAKSLLTISGFVLDEKLQKNASKFAIFLEKENPNSFFSIFHFELFVEYKP